MLFDQENSMTRSIRGLLAMLAIVSITACGGDDDAPPPGNLAEVAQANGLTALTAAATKAGLVPTLTSASANLTVFAPTNAAFNTLATRLGFPDATAMVNALPAPALANILSYHVLGSRKGAAELAAGGATQATAYTFGGAPATLAVNTTSGVTLTDAVLTSARVTAADVPASNGVVHVVDKVLVPPGVLNIVQMAQANPAFSTLVGAVVSANLQGTLSGSGPFTVFAPTNDAFAAIASTVAGLTTQQLTTVLTYHVLGQQVLSSQIPFGTPVTTVSGQSITINASPLTITDTTSTPAPIAATDVRASNGVIHVVGKVLIPAL
jgi:transforming growth factor-beta-induced protein